MDRLDGQAPPGAGACEGALQRIDAALARFDGALARRQSAQQAENSVLEGRNERLRLAIDGALRDIDRLIGHHAMIAPPSPATPPTNTPKTPVQQTA